MLDSNNALSSCMDSSHRARRAECRRIPPVLALPNTTAQSRRSGPDGMWKVGTFAQDFFDCTCKPCCLRARSCVSLGRLVVEHSLSARRWAAVECFCKSKHSVHDRGSAEQSSLPAIMLGR